MTIFCVFAGSERWFCGAWATRELAEVSAEAYRNNLRDKRKSRRQYWVEEKELGTTPFTWNP